MLTQFHTLPPGLLDCAADQLHTILPGPSLIHLEGVEPSPLFVSILLHGNEIAGLNAMQALLKKYRQRGLPRSLSMFVGNIEAARHGVRRLDQQPDYNRIWPGSDQPPSAEMLMMNEIVEEMKKRQPFASIDIHNNTGTNPHYACINSLDKPFLQLATLFGRIIVYFLRPLGVQSAAFAKICPAITLECGKPTHTSGAEHAFNCVDSCLHLTEIPDKPIAKRDLDLIETVAQVFIREDISFGFADNGVDFSLNSGIDHMNFTRKPAGTSIGRTRLSELPIIARDQDGTEVTADYFTLDHGLVKFTRAVLPAMFSPSTRAIRQDCLCYLMQAMPLDGSHLR